ncbi:MAG: hypothetical protein R3F62_08085 [Planctomycetota bacterium]
MPAAPRLRALVCVLSLSLGCASGPEPPPAGLAPSVDPFAIAVDPGWSAAGVQLNVDRAYVLSRLGSPDSYELTQDGGLDRERLHYAMGVTVVLVLDRVDALFLDRSYLEHLQVESPLGPETQRHELLERWGRPARDRYGSDPRALFYPQQGLRCEFDDEGRLTRVHFFPYYLPREEDLLPSKQPPQPASRAARRERPAPALSAANDLPPAPAPHTPAAPEPAAPSGRRLAVSGARVHLSASSPAARLREVADAPAPRSGWRWASPVFELEAAPGYGPEPHELAVTLDPAALPAGVAPEDVALVLVHDGRLERLRDARYDAASGEVRCATRRTAALVHARGGGTDLSQRNARFALAVPLTRQELVSEDDWYEVWVARDRRDEVESDLDALRALLERVRGAFPTFGDAQPPFVYVHLVDLPPGVAGQASGGNTVELSAAGRWGYAAVAHEYFHLIQQTFMIRHLDALGEVVDPETLFRGRWLAEATAEFMAQRVLDPAERAAQPLWPGTHGFCYRGLFEVDEFDVPGVPRQYVAATFFDFLAEHYDAEALIRRCYEVFMSREHVRALDTWSDAYVLRGVLATTVDRRGRTRTLNQVYAEFLLHYNWLKDFEPLRSRVAKLDLGPAGAVRVPPDRLQRRQVPSPDGDRQVRVRASGPGYSIVAAYAFSPPAQAGEGDLVLELSADDEERPVDGKLLLVAFPVKGGAYGAPVLRGPDEPLTLSDWSAHDEALVWVVDASPFGAHEGRLTARFEGPDPRLAQASVALKVKACTPAGAERGRFQSPTARLELWFEGVDTLGLDPRASDPVRTAGGSPNANYLLLRFDYDGLTGYRLIDDEGLDDLELPLRRVGAFPATLQVFAPGFDGPVLRHAFEVACVEGEPRGEVPARFAEEDARLAARWPQAVAGGSYALWSQWLQNHDRRVQAQRASLGAGWLLKHADELAQEFDRRVAAVGNPFQRGATPPLPGVRLDLELYRARFDVANDWLRQIESWAKRPAHPPERSLEFRRTYFQEGAYRRVARVYAEWLLDGDAAEDLFLRYRALRPGDATPLFSDFERAIERARAARRVYPPAAFAR